MRRRTTISILVLTSFACGEEPPAPEPALTIAPLSTKPGCYSPIVTLAPCDTEEEPECERSREANVLAQKQIEALTDPFVNIVEAIRAAPTEPSWTAQYTWPAPHDLVTNFTVTPTLRGERTGSFDVLAHDVGRYVPEGDLPMDIDGTRDMFGFYTPNFVTIDVSEGVIRWTSNVATAGSFYRGCDPSQGVSFDQRYLDNGTFTLFCWDNDSGNQVDCQTVDLWPTD